MNVIWEQLEFKGDVSRFLEALKDEPRLFVLDSSLYETERGRYSMIGFDPFYYFQESGSDVLAALRQKYAALAFGPTDCPVPFQGGIVGYMTYDYGARRESVQHRKKSSFELADVYFAFYDSAVVVDHFADTLYIVSTGLPEIEEGRRLDRARQRLGALKKVITHLPVETENAVDVLRDKNSLLPLVSDMTQAQYYSMFQKAQDYISSGDVYQVNLAQKFSCVLTNRDVAAMDIYHILRSLSPSAFGAYLDCGNFQVISSSPERFLSASGRVVQTRPMKGTRPRGRDLEEDRRLKSEMLLSTKEKAELLMVTDLERNDLGKVCEYGTVKVKELRTIEEYRTVFQATSLVEGKLRDGKDVFDCLEACFPSGSVTGCPKIRSMQIIEELEPSRRFIYTGALGYVSFSGDADFNILIRTILKQGQDISFHVGSGIVADSTAEAEYQETLVKAKAMREALSTAARYCPHHKGVS